MPDRPNILHIHSHDTGRYIQPYGHPVPTPNLQRLAEQGALFRQAFCAGPTCSPSRAGLLTGQAPHSCGQFGLAHRGFPLRDTHKHLAVFLKSAGYSTHLIGIHHEVRDPRTIYENVAKVASSRAEHVAPTATEFLSQRPRDPFFLSVGFSETHRTFPAPGPTEDLRYTLPPPLFPDTPQTRADMAAFKASARMLDAGMGAVIHALDHSGLGQNTLVICTTDHGMAFPNMKCNLTDHGTGVMLILRGPGGFTGGKVIDALVSQMDIFPTLCDVAGIEPPPWLQGKSLVPLVSDGRDEVHDAIFSEINYHVCYEPQRMARTRRWKYIRRFDDRRKPVLPDCDDSPTKTVWMEHGWRDREFAGEQLYDLMFDPHEVRDLARDPAHQGVLTDMRRQLERWMVETDDPLLKGPIPAPSAATLNLIDGESPSQPTYKVP
jgi:arylsulfatase A-like enzyme